MTPLTTEENVALIDMMVGTDEMIHEEDVFSWREQEFKRLGYIPHEASVLAGTRIDIHEIDRLLNGGADHATAWQILVGTRERGIHDPEWDERYGYSKPAETLEDDDDGA